MTKFSLALSIAKSNSITDNQLPYSQFLEEQSKQTILDRKEVDSAETGIYRVWRDSLLLGQLHRDIPNGLWISRPRNYKLIPRLKPAMTQVLFIDEMTAIASA